MLSVFLRRFIVPGVPLIDGDAGVVSHGAVDEGGLCVRDIPHHILRTGFKFDLVKEHKFGVHVIADVPNTKQEFDVNLAVLIAGDVDGVQHVDFVLERDGSIRHVKQGLLGERVNR